MDLFYFTHAIVRQVPELTPLTLWCYDLTIMLHGTMRYSINGEEVILQEGDGYLFTPGDYRSREPGKEAEYYSFNYYFPDGNVTLPPLKGLLAGCVTREIEQLMLQYEKYSQGLQDTARPCGREIGLCYFRILYLTLYGNRQPFIQSSHVDKIKRYVREHLHERISLADISGAVYLSPNYCNSVFKQQTGQTLSSYIIQEKIAEAKHLMLQSSAPMTEIAASLGYPEYSYFSRLFRRSQGITPQQFRRGFRTEQIGPEDRVHTVEESPEREE